MADFVGKLFGGQKPFDKSGEDTDFADFAGAPDPSPASISPVTQVSAGDAAAATGELPVVPYTKWYRVWERTSPNEFKLEAVTIPILLLAIFVHIWGAKKNRKSAHRWASNHIPILADEFALVGFGGTKAPSLDDVSETGLAKVMANKTIEDPNEFLKEKTPQEYVSYASGRRNVAFVDVKLKYFKRYNPVSLAGEYAMSLFFDSMSPPAERMDIILYPFDGRETSVVPVQGGEEGQKSLQDRKGLPSSTFDNFVWAVVHKDGMKRLREDRYDISLTSTKDHPKLPVWATIMSESAEITQHLLTDELIDALKKAGDVLEYLIVSDQPLDRPAKVDETTPKKRIQLGCRLTDDPEQQLATLPLFSYFLRMTDRLVSTAHFRPEVTRKIRQTREDQVRKLQRLDEVDKAEERAIKRDREKKEKRDAALKGLSADEQRKFLEKEREKETKKSQRKMVQR